MSKVNPSQLPFSFLRSFFQQGPAPLAQLSAQLWPAAVIEEALQGFLACHSATAATVGKSSEGLRVQGAGQPQDSDAAAAAQARIRDIMGNYDPEDDDADEKAQKIAGDPELNKCLTKEQRAALIKGLFDGNTGEEEEDAAVALLEAAGPDDLKWVIKDIGWEELNDELDAGDLDQINTWLARPSLQESESVFEKFGMSPADLDPDTGLERSQFDKRVNDYLDSLTPDELRRVVQDLHADKRNLLKEVADTQRRGQDPNARELKRIVELVAEKVTDPAAKSRMKQLAFEIQYTRDISENLRTGDYGELLNLLPVMVDPDASVEERVAVFETMSRRESELRAMQEVVRELGMPNQIAQMDRFMNTYDAFMNSFGPELPQQDLLDRVLDELRDFLGNIKAEWQEFKATYDETIRKVGEYTTLSHVLETDVDDQAEDLVSNLLSKGLLDDVPTDVKVKLIQELNDGATEDAQEQRILDILRETKAHDPEEFYQIVAAVGWDELDSNIHGDEWEEFLRLMNS